jgi:hypothetical protein
MCDPRCSGLRWWGLCAPDGGITPRGDGGGSGLDAGHGSGQA